MNDELRIMNNGKIQYFTDLYQSLLILHTFYQKMSLRMVIPVANSFASGINIPVHKLLSTLIKSSKNKILK